MTRNKWLFVLLARSDGWSILDSVRLLLSTLCVFWLTWGTMGGLIGLMPLPVRRVPASPVPSGARSIEAPPPHGSHPMGNEVSGWCIEGGVDARCRRASAAA